MRKIKCARELVNEIRGESEQFHFVTFTNFQNLVIAPARRAGDPVRILVQARIFSLKLLIYDLSEGYSEAKISSNLIIQVLSFTLKPLNKVMPHRCSPPSRIDGTSASRRVMEI